MVTADGKVVEVTKNGSRGRPKFPSAFVFFGSAVYISDNDTPRRDKDANGKTSLDGIGASIAQITP